MVESDDIEMENLSVDKENKDAASSPAKGGKSADASDAVSAEPGNNIATLWEYEFSHGNWIRYTQDITDKLNAANVGDSVKETIEETEVEFDLADMRQVNMITGMRRNIRCVVKSDDTYFVWEHMKGRRYAPLPRVAQQQLEKSLSASESTTSITLNNEVYNVDIDDMKMRGAKEVRLRRTETKAEDSMTALPVPTAERTRGLTKRSVKSVDYKKDTKIDEDDNDDAETVPIKKSRGRKPKVDDDEDDEPKPSKSGSSKSGSGSMKSTKRTIILKGRAPVDPECTEKVKTAHILEEGDTVWDCMLNQTNIANNNNKFYIIQLLKDDDSSNYSVWFRWARVGYRGQMKLEKYGGDIEAAKRSFTKKFNDKTLNDWGDRNDFEAYPGKYTLIKMDYTVPDRKPFVDADGEIKEEEENEEPVELEDSKLDRRVKDFLHLICNIQTMEETVTEMEYDSAKVPLGKITSEQIAEGYRLLGEIEKFIKKKTFNKDFVATVNEYYTKIPHNFGFKQPPLIKTEEALQKESELLDVLEDIEIAIKTLESGKTKGDKRAVVDRYYDNMKCELSVLNKDTSEYEMVEEYLRCNHASTHSYKMKVQNIFKVTREGEDERFKGDLGNRQLLWHGSRLTNWYGILSQGLRIAPPEAPTTGYMFGKGVYFADMASKSGNYCYPSNNKPGVLLLADVALGDTNDLLNADYDAHKLPSGKNSTKGVGAWVPDQTEKRVLDDGLVVPIGKPIKGTNNRSLLYNEYIVYDVSQIRMKYAVEVQFSL